MSTALRSFDAVSIEFSLIDAWELSMPRAAADCSDVTLISDPQARRLCGRCDATKNYVSVIHRCGMPTLRSHNSAILEISGDMGPWRDPLRGGERLAVAGTASSTTPSHPLVQPTSPSQQSTDPYTHSVE